MTIIVPPLSERAHEPAGWRSGTFVNEKTGHKIHYGCAYPYTDSPPGAVVVMIQGLSEPTQKYYETARDMLDRGYAVWTYDLYYQGLSGRYPQNPHKRHSDGVDADISDFQKFVADYIKPAAVHPERGRIPLVMIAHSLGANIGLRYLAENPGYFDAAAFSSPCLGIYNFTLPQKILALIVKPLLLLVGARYVLNADWNENTRKHDGSDIFSSDPDRDGRLAAWFKANPDLQVGGVTFRFVLELLKSCKILERPETAAAIKIPVILALPEHEYIVDNDKARRFAQKLPQGELLEIKGARHEILMEKDEYRNQFLDSFDKMMERHNIASLQNLKRF